jgi:hypothetical protein
LKLPEVDGRRSEVADAGRLVGFLDPVTVVTGAFDRAGAGPVPPGRVRFADDLGQDLRQGPLPVLATKTALAELLARDLSRMEIKVLMLDGEHLADHLAVVALAVTAEGTKVPVGLWEGH